jgi:hypothetical protein
MREKAIDSGIKVEGLPVFIQEVPARKWYQDPKFKAVISIGIPVILLTHGVGIPIAALAASRVMAAALSPQSVANAPVVNPGDAVPVMAGVSASVHSKVLHAFDPLINLAQDLAYPIAGVMIAVGSIFIMIGNKEKGMQYLTNAALGYILVQLVPLMLSLLVGVGSSV